MLFELQNIIISLKTDNPKFEEFVIANIGDYIIQTTEIVDFSIEINFLKKNKKKFIRPQIYFGSEVYFDEKVLHWISKKLQILVHEKGNKYIIEANANFRIDQHLRKFFGIKGEYEYNLFLITYRFVILYPLMMRLSNLKRFSVIHSSATYNKKNKSIDLFIGLNGVGKSTLAYTLSKHEDYDLISDNFVFIKDSKFFPVPEVIRLPKDLSIIYDKSRIMGTANNKSILKPNTNIYKSKEGLQIKRIFFVTRNTISKNTTVKEIGNEKAIDYLFKIANYLKEYENYSYITFLEKEKYKTDIENYTNLVNNTKKYIYEIGNGANNSAEFLRLFKS